MSTRTRVDVRRVPGTEGLPGYSVFITIDANLCFKVACGDYFKAYLTSAVITVTM